MSVHTRKLIQSLLSTQRVHTALHPVTITNVCAAGTCARNLRVGTISRSQLRRHSCTALSQSTTLYVIALRNHLIPHAYQCTYTLQQQQTRERIAVMCSSNNRTCYQYRLIAEEYLEVRAPLSLALLSSQYPSGSYLQPERVLSESFSRANTAVMSPARQNKKEC